jgi:hypothetical protein
VGDATLYVTSDMHHLDEMLIEEGQAKVLQLFNHMKQDCRPCYAQGLEPLERNELLRREAFVQFQKLWHRPSSLPLIVFLVSELFTELT